jgi:tetratricopeptide (TPR) repeat protein
MRSRTAQSFASAKPIAAALLVAAVTLFFSGCAADRPTPTRSSSYSFQASEQWADGNVYGAWELYKRSLSAARQEADEAKEFQVLLNMADIKLQALQFRSADSLLHLLPEEPSRLPALRSQMFLAMLRTQVGLGSCKDANVVGSWLASGIGTQGPEAAADGAGNDAGTTPRVRGLLQLELSRCALLSGNANQAEQEFASAQKLLTGEGEGQLALQKGRILLAQGDAAAAIEQFNLALERAKVSSVPPAVGVVLFDLGRAYQKQGKNAEAAHAFDRALKLYESLKLSLPYLVAGQAWIATGQPSDEQRATYEKIRGKNIGPELDRALVLDLL